MKILPSSLLQHGFLSAVAILSLAGIGHAGIVVWSAPQNITGPADVRNLGPLVGAFNVGNGGVPDNTLVNSVNFRAFPVNSGGGPVTTAAAPSNANFVLTTSVPNDFFASDNSAYGSASAPFSNLSAGYRTILQSATTTFSPTTFDLDISGLIPNQQYEFQWWSNLSGPGAAPTKTHTATSAGGATIVLNDNPSNLEGGLGQYGIGNFLATGATQKITFGPGATGGFAQLNAFQLRAIPEPGTALFGLALFGICSSGAFRRRRTSTSA